MELYKEYYILNDNLLSYLDISDLSKIRKRLIIIYITNRNHELINYIKKVDKIIKSTCVNMPRDYSDNTSYSKVLKDSDNDLVFKLTVLIGTAIIIYLAIK